MRHPVRSDVSDHKAPRRPAAALQQTRWMRRASAWIALMAVFIGTPVCAQWKWRDAQGRMQYSDRPPPLVPSCRRAAATPRLLR
ncbi:MAG: DUF4124 domain-containing protein [Leptothrix sp. (in: b-proteobacteria)]